jgi:hypothetical protein
LYPNNPQDQLQQDMAVLDTQPPTVDAAPQEQEVLGPITDDDIDKAIIEIVEDFEIRCRSVREAQIRFWRKCELYWEGLQSIIYDETEGTLRSAADVLANLESRRDEFDPYYYDKIVNIYRAYGESIIAALSQEVPAVIFPPDDADNPDDVTTSKGYTKISQLISKHNKAPMLLSRALFILWNQGLLAAYTYSEEDFKYGKYQVNQTEMQPQLDKSYSCPICGKSFADAPDLNGNGYCDSCDKQVTPDEEYIETQVPRVVGVTDAPKSRERIKIYGPLEVFIPHYVREPEHIPVCVLKSDCHYTYAQELYPDFADKLVAGSSNDKDQYDRWSRSYPEGRGQDEDDLLTINRCWLRPFTYNKFIKHDPELVAELKRRYPEGVFATIINQVVVEKEAELMDDRWTFSINPLSSHLHAKPLGAPLLPLQDIRNELVLLKLQSVEYGIPETFAEATAINWKAYAKNPAKPGMLSPAKALTGRSLNDSFTTLNTAVFPKESIEFQAEIDADAQFVSGGFPSIWGGQLSGGGKTAAEYQMSKNQALQRLSNSWRFITWWWAELMSKAVHSFHKNMVEDEKLPQKNGGRWENVWIRRTELTGNIGLVEPEVGDNFPQSWSQKRDMVMQLFQLNNDNINAALFHPENTGLLAQLLGFGEFYIPGDNDRTKQLVEIAMLLQAEPVENLDNNGLEITPPTSSVQVDPEIDNHQVEFEACQTWMTSDNGQDAKLNNPAGFANVRAHAAEHKMYIDMAAQQEQQQAQQGSEDNSSGGPPNA